MSEISVQYFKSDFGELILGSFEDQLCLCDWRYRRMRSSIDKRIVRQLGCDYKIQSTGTIKKAIKQLTEYSEGKRTHFDIPLMLIGSTFQVQVWNELLSIAYGQTESYLGLSKRLNNEGAIRAVASANGANAISIIVPCHRIIGSHGELTGYAGGISVKKKLLELEAPQKFNKQFEIFK